MKITRFCICRNEKKEIISISYTVMMARQYDVRDYYPKPKNLRRGEWYCSGGTSYLNGYFIKYEYNKKKNILKKYVLKKIKKMIQQWSMEKNRGNYRFKRYNDSFVTPNQLKNLQSEV